MAVCSFCGISSTDVGTSSGGARDAAGTTDLLGELPLTWVTSLENGKPRVYCDRCARDHLRSIESKLDAEWW